MITDNAYLRRCRECFYPHPARGDSMIRFALPKLNKKVIYIDQFAISNMMKALNPQTKAYQKGTIDQFWLRLYERLDRLCKLQLIICPMSESHREESIFSSFFKALERMYTLLSYGVGFDSPGVIKQFQVSKHAKEWIVGRGDEEIELNVHDIINGNINAWQEKLIISSNIQYSQDLMDDWRRSRERTREVLKRVFERWSSEKEKTFNEWFKEEVMGFGDGILRNYFSDLKRFEDIFVDRIMLTSCNIFPSESIILVLEIRDVFREAGIKDVDILPKTIEYFTSPSIKNVPCVKICAMLWAALARKTASGRLRIPTYGMKVDIEMLSVLLPYCDAIFIDRECHAFLKEMPLQKEIDYGTRVFSMTNKEEFFDYLNEIETSVSKEHLYVVQEVYGEEWLKPYTTLYQEKSDHL